MGYVKMANPPTINEYLANSNRYIGIRFSINSGLFGEDLVFTSSPSVVHAGGDIEGGNESLPYPEKFQAPYPATKALAEQLVMAANGPDLQTASLRPHFIWGPGDTCRPRFGRVVVDHR